MQSEQLAERVICVLNEKTTISDVSIINLKIFLKHDLIICKF